MYKRSRSAVHKLHKVQALTTPSAVLATSAGPEIYLVATAVAAQSNQINILISNLLQHHIF